MPRRPGGLVRWPCARSRRVVTSDGEPRDTDCGGADLLLPCRHRPGRSATGVRFHPATVPHRAGKSLAACRVVYRAPASGGRRGKNLDGKAHTRHRPARGARERPLSPSGESGPGAFARRGLSGRPRKIPRCLAGSQVGDTGLEPPRKTRRIPGVRAKAAQIAAHFPAILPQTRRRRRPPPRPIPSWRRWSRRGPTCPRRSAPACWRW